MIKRTLLYSRTISKSAKYFDLNKSKLPVKNSISDNLDYFEKETKHRPIYTIYDLTPEIDYYSFIAPNATVLGEVSIGNGVSVGYNSVIRGDINSVEINKLACIGDHCVIHTANSLPTGLPASVSIGETNIIQNRVTLFSCITEKNVFIGHGSVVLEGSRIEQGAVILPNSVVPPGRIIPAHQVWGGNPVRYVRDLKQSEVFSNYANAFSLWNISRSHVESMHVYNYSYLEKESFKEDLDLAPEDIVTINESDYSEYEKTHILL